MSKTTAVKVAFTAFERNGKVPIVTAEVAKWSVLRNVGGAMDEEAKIGDKVRIKSSATNFADGAMGTLEGFLEGGYAVRIETNVPITGVLATWEKRETVVWAAVVERLE